MIKISLDNAQKVDITARRNDNFDLSIDITDAEGEAVVFQGNPEAPISGPNLQIFEQHLHLKALPGLLKAYRDLLIFTITDENYDPILIASDTPLNINYYDYYNLNQYNGNSMRYAQGVARTLSRYAGDNVLLDSDNYGTTSAVEQLINGSISNPENAVSHYQSRFFKESIESIELAEDLNLYDTDLNNMRAGSYIATGTIHTTNLSGNRTNPIKISFSQKDFNLPKGTYKYTLRSLNNFRKVNENANVAQGYVFRDCATWLYGKIKVTEY